MQVLGHNLLPARHLSRKLDLKAETGVGRGVRKALKPRFSNKGCRFPAVSHFNCYIKHLLLCPQCFLQPFIHTYTAFMLCLLWTMLQYMGIQMFLWQTVFISFEDMTRSGITDNKVVLFIIIIFWNLHIVSYNGCTNLHSQQQCSVASFPSHPWWHWPFMFLIEAVLTGMRWYLRFQFAFSSLVILSIFFHITVIWMSSFKKSVFKSNTYF